MERIGLFGYYNYQIFFRFFFISHQSFVFDCFFFIISIILYMIEGTLKQQNHRISNFINNVIIDFKNLNSTLRQANKHSFQANTSIINKLLLSNDRDSLQVVKGILSHLLHIVDLKGMNTLVLSILTKVISFIKIMEEEQIKAVDKLFSKNLYGQEMSNILYYIIDIIFLLKNKYKDNDMILRIIQTTFSLIDSQILQYVNYHIIIRIYSICFECCLSNPIIENISTSALFALTQIIFISNKIEDSQTILAHFLEYIFTNKKFTWIKDQQFKKIVWDLIIVGVKNYPTCELQHLMSNQNILALINQMYKLSIQKVFTSEQVKIQKPSNKNKKAQTDKNNSKKIAYNEFIQYYKAFIILSVYLSVKASPFQIELVPFKQNIHLFKVIYEMERDFKLYILLEGVSFLLIEASNLLVEDERTLLLLQIFSKIIQELCLTNVEVQINSEPKDLYLQKMCVDFSKINDSDFVKLTKSSIIKLRKKFEGKIDRKVKTGELLTERTEISQKSDLQNSEVNLTSARKKWQKLINNVIKVIRYLTSLNLKENSSQQTVRKIILQLQYWYLICPSLRTRNYILQQLLNTSTLILTKIQAVKVSQCVQIGSNIIYGYYDSLDTIGLTMILKMMAGVKTSWQDGKGFQELDEVCTMSEKLYIQQRLVNNLKSFSKTIQAFVQCVNSLMADVQNPKQDKQKTGRSSLEKIFKMAEYIFSKLENILNQNLEYIHDQWNFLTGFWISLCSNPNKEAKHMTMNHIGSIITLILNKSQIKQEAILSTYLQLSKLHSLQISRLVISQLKTILLKVNSQEAIVEIFIIVKIVLQTKVCQSIINDVYQLQEMLIKELVFKVKSTQHLIFIIDSFTSFSGEKNQQYKTVNLIWNISDHLKTLAQNGELKQVERVWRSLFQKLYYLGLYSIHGQTKQACIHTFTQILAESLHILGVELFLTIVKQVYIQLFYICMSINQKSPKLENVIQVQTMKIGIKNLIKIIKKCLSDKLINSCQIINDITQKIAKYLTDSKALITIQYQYELCALLQFIKNMTKKQQQANHLVQKKSVKDLLDKMQANHANFDQASLMWRKKYQPIFKQFKTSLDI